MPSSRRWTKFTVATLAASSLVAAGCGGSSGGGGEANAGTLTIAVQADLRTPDNVLNNSPDDKLLLGSTVYDSLFTVDKNVAIQPDLALKATPSPDLKTWTVTLRDGVKFTNGKPFTANDVKANMDAFLNAANGGGLHDQLANISSTEVVNPTEVKFNLASPDGNLPASLSDVSGVFMADLDARGGKQLLPAGEAPIGTGPYKWSSRQSGSSVTFERNDDYWRGKPPLDSVVFQVIPDPQVASLALENGEVDLMTNYVAPDSVARLKANNELDLLSTPGSTFYNGWFNFEKDRRGGYKDFEKVRQGLTHVLNQQEIIPKVIGEYGTYGSQPIPPWQPGSDPTITSPPYDPDMGKKLLADGGIPEGGTIKILAWDAPYGCDWGLAEQSQLKSLGYDAQFNCVASELAPAETTKYDWDLLIGRTSGRPTAAVFLNQRWSMEIADPSDDYYTLRDPQLQAIIDKMNLTTDPAAYEELGKSASRRIVTEDIAIAGGYFENAYLVANKKVKGLVINPMVYCNILYGADGPVSIST
jgi:peptide/nickel transport system substrate-binding protein